MKSPKEIRTLIESALKKREGLYPVTHALRLVNGLGDGLPGLAIDQYHQHLMVLVYDAQWAPRLKIIKEILIKKLNPSFLIFKDASIHGQEENPYQYLTIDKVNPQTVVTENGLKFIVDLDDHINTGLFLDMRLNRKIVGSVAAHKKVLNCFAYTCSFGVYCRSYGAEDVVNIDISQKSLERGAKNYELNGLVSSPQEFTCSDVLKYLALAVKKNNFFDVVILDPPSFSRYEGKVFSIKKDLVHLIESAIQILKPEGYLFVATNHSDMTHDILESLVKKSALKLRKSVKKISTLGQDKDFPGSGLMKESSLAALLIHLR